jgi:hypothetical protein
MRACCMLFGHPFLCLTPRSSVFPFWKYFRFYHDVMMLAYYESSFIVGCVNNSWLAISLSPSSMLGIDSDALNKIFI